MSNPSYTVKAPGKLMIAGEYAVLDPNQKSIVIAVNRYATAYIEACEENTISIPQWGLDDISWEINNDYLEIDVIDSRLDFIKNSIYISYKFLKEKGINLNPFKITIKSELNDPLTGKKYGLGSSAAIVVSVITAIIKYHSQYMRNFTLDQIFKLSVVTHFITQKNGSGADIAAAVYGGWIEYTAFNSDWLLEELNENDIMSLITDEIWPNLSIKPLSPPSSLKLIIGWTKEVAKTAPMVDKFNYFRDTNIELYNEFIKESRDSVDRLISSFHRNDSDEAIMSISRNRKALQKLGEYARINIETEKIKLLCDIAEEFGSGKSSGAGGGDCGIAFLTSYQQMERLYKEWKTANIMPLDLNVSEKGVTIE